MLHHILQIVSKKASEKHPGKRPSTVLFGCTGWREGRVSKRVSKSKRFPLKNSKQKVSNGCQIATPPWFHQVGRNSCLLTLQGLGG